MSITYRAAKPDDVDTITKLSVKLYDEMALYKENDVKKHEELEFFAYNESDLRNKNMAMFLAFDGEKAVGFSHVFIRYEYVIGTESAPPVGYLEGIYVCPEYRRRGVAKALVLMCEEWSGEKGCAEFASDCELGNTESLKFHLKIGFRETNRIIFFAKKL